jgi:hypothetical protein
VIIQPVTPPNRRRPRPHSGTRFRSTWPLTPYGTLAAMAMLAGIAMVVMAMWVS